MLYFHKNEANIAKENDSEYYYDTLIPTKENEDIRNLVCGIILQAVQDCFSNNTTDHRSSSLVQSEEARKFVSLDNKDFIACCRFLQIDANRIVENVSQKLLQNSQKKKYKKRRGW